MEIRNINSPGVVESVKQAGGNVKDVLGASIDRVLRDREEVADSMSAEKSVEKSYNGRAFEARNVFSPGNEFTEIADKRNASLRMQKSKSAEPGLGENVDEYV